MACLWNDSVTNFMIDVFMISSARLVIGPGIGHLKIFNRYFNYGQNIWDKL